MRSTLRINGQNGRGFIARPHLHGNRFSRSSLQPARCVASKSDLPDLLEINGYIMVGEYPFVNGFSCMEHVDGEARLKVVLNAGITAFASMLSELPSQEDMPIGGVKNYVPYKPTADLIAASISGPPPSEVVEGLRNPYIDNYLPKRRREPSEAYQKYKPLRPKYFHFDMQPEMAQNNPEALDQFLSQLEAEIRDGGAVYVHCTGGTGRAGVTAAALLVKIWGVPPEEALKRVQLTRNLRGDKAPDGSFIESPHNDSQRAFVQDFCQRYL